MLCQGNNIRWLIIIFFTSNFLKCTTTDYLYVDILQFSRGLSLCVSTFYRELSQFSCGLFVWLFLLRTRVWFSLLLALLVCILKWYPFLMLIILCAFLSICVLVEWVSVAQLWDCEQTINYAEKEFKQAETLLLKSFAAFTIREVFK